MLSCPLKLTPIPNPTLTLKCRRKMDLYPLGAALVLVMALGYVFGDKLKFLAEVRALMCAHVSIERDSSSMTTEFLPRLL